MLLGCLHGQLSPEAETSLRVLLGENCADGRLKRSNIIDAIVVTTTRRGHMLSKQTLKATGQNKPNNGVILAATSVTHKGSTILPGIVVYQVRVALT